MIARAGFRSVLVLLALLSVPGAARAEASPATTILVLPSAAEAGGDLAPWVPPATLVYAVPRGDFARRLDAIVAGASESSAELVAQAAEDPVPAGSPRLEESGEEQPDLSLPIVGGVVGAAAGLYGGALLGLIVTTDDDSELGFEELTGMLSGAILGEIVGVSAGAHLGNARKGSFGKDLLVATLVGLAGWGLTLTTESGAVAALSGVVQLGLVIGAERRVGASRIAERAAADARGP